MINLNEQNQMDIAFLLSLQSKLGATLWMSDKGSLIKGSPFTTLQCVRYLLELGMTKEDPILQAIAHEILNRIKPDGRVQVTFNGTIYPCHTIQAVNTLCLLGYVNDPRLQPSMHYLLEQRYFDGGWRCNKFSYGKGKETECSNPGPTLMALDAFRWVDQEDMLSHLDSAVELLLSHWETRLPMGPCHYGIGSLFMQLEYPFNSYNIFYYVYVLSFYPKARKDPRFLEALLTIQAKMNRGEFVIERVPKAMAHLFFCQKGKASAHALKRYQEIIDHVAKEKSR